MEGYLLVIVAFLSALVGAVIGSTRGHPCMAALAGLFLGPIGWILAAVTDSHDRCPRCAQPYHHKAKVCPWCSVRLVAEAPANGQAPAPGAAGTPGRRAVLRADAIPPVR